MPGRAFAAEFSPRRGSRSRSGSGRANASPKSRPTSPSPAACSKSQEGTRRRFSAGSRSTPFPGWVRRRGRNWRRSTSTRSATWRGSPVTSSRRRSASRGFRSSSVPGGSMTNWSMDRRTCRARSLERRRSRTTRPTSASWRPRSGRSRDQPPPPFATRSSGLGPWSSSGATRSSARSRRERASRRRRAATPTSSTPSSPFSEGVTTLAGGSVVELCPEGETQLDWFESFRAEAEPRARRAAKTQVG